MASSATLDKTRQINNDEHLDEEVNKFTKALFELLSI